MTEPSLVATRIRELARQMVRLDAEIEAARARRRWYSLGSLTAQRLTVQAHRSDLLVQQWKAQRQMNWRYVGEALREA